MKASVIILTWNGIEYLGACLRAVLAQDYPDFEVIVVDNGSVDGSPAFVAEHYPQVKLIYNERNLGFAIGNNVGLRQANGDILVLLNVDTEVRPGWLTALTDTFADPTIGIVGCKLLYPDGTIQHAGGYLYGPRGEAGHVGWHAHDDGQFDRLVEAEFVTGAALAITRRALAGIGLLDEGFSPIYYEDIDWCCRARAAGLRVAFQPSAVVTHHESASMSSLDYDRKYALNHGRLRFVFKNWPLERLLAEFGPAELAWVRAMDRNTELMAARRAYLKTILDLGGIVAFRASPSPEAESLIGLLTELRSAALTSLASLAIERDQLTPSSEAQLAVDRERASLLDALRADQTIREVPFTSNVPLLGRLIVTFRTLWNSVATKWYVRPMAQQQSVFNAQVVSYLQAQEQLLQGQFRDVAENIRELTALAEHLARLEGSDAPDKPRD